jgi:hypothetical protein
MDHWDDICIFSPQCNYLNCGHIKYFFLLPQQLKFQNVLRFQIEKWMEKLEESETKKKLSMKTGIVAVSVSVSCMTLSTHYYH